MLTETDLAEIERRANAATPGPWAVWDGCSWRRIGSEATQKTVIEPIRHHRDSQPDLESESGQRDENLEFAAHSRTDVPALLATIRELQAESDDAHKLLEAMTEACEFLRVKLEGGRMTWQPIETAPKDGTLVLVYCPHNFAEERVLLADYHIDRFCIHIDGQGVGVPTHWMPLPEPPTEGESK